MASTFPGSVAVFPTIPTPTLTNTNVAPTLSTRLQQHSDAIAAVENWLITNMPGLFEATGVVKAFAGTAAPTGYLFCDGSAVSRSTFATLFSVIGTTYGTGDGSTTFNLPDLRGRVVMGVGTGAGLTTRTLAQTLGQETHVLVTSELASHTHGITDPGHVHPLVPAVHGHAISDPGHVHPYIYKNLENPGAGGQAGSNFQNLQQTINTTAAVTGIIGTQGSTTGDTVGSATAGINGTLSQGNNVAHNNIQPVLVLNWIIKT